MNLYKMKQKYTPTKIKIIFNINLIKKKSKRNSSKKITTDKKLNVAENNVFDLPMETNLQVSQNIIVPPPYVSIIYKK